MLRHTSVRLVAVVLATLAAAETSWAAPHQRSAAKRRVHATHRRAARTQSRTEHKRAVTRKQRPRASAPKSTPAVVAISYPAENRPVTAGPVERATKIAASPVSKPTVLNRRRTTPLMIEAPARPLGGNGLAHQVISPVPVDRLNLLGVIEAPKRDMRLAIIAVNGRIVRGRTGDVVDERYRIGAFTEAHAELVDIATDQVIGVTPSMPDPVPVAEAKPAAAGALRVVGEPKFAEIYVDGAYVGTVAEISDAPDGLPLEAGSHQLDLQASEHEPVGLAVRISPNRTTTYHVALVKERR